MSQNIFPIDFEEKNDIAQNDYILFSDSQDCNKLKKAQYSNLKGEKGDGRWYLLEDGKVVTDSTIVSNILDMGPFIVNIKSFKDVAPNKVTKTEKVETTKPVEKETKPVKKNTTSKQVKEEINNLISDTRSEIGDEGDWDWYKKMKKKDVITYLEDQVLDEFSDARKRGYDYGLEWSEVQKLIKKFVNDRMK